MLVVFVFISPAYPQFNPPYPRTAVQHFGKAVPEYYARYDLVIFPRTNPDEVKAIKAINPDCIILSTHVWTQWIKNFGLKPFPEAWFTRDSKGKILAPEHGNQLIDVTNFCTKVDGKRYNEAMPAFLKRRVDLNVFDGIGTDWAWGKPHRVSDIDLDKNGKNDYQEPGKGKAWVIQTWREGLVKFVKQVRANIGENKLLWVNSGDFHNWGIEDSNGINLCHYAGFFSWKRFLREYKKFMRRARKPHVFIMAARPWVADPRRTNDSKNYLPFMRFMLCATLMGDGYFQYQPIEAGEHHYYHYYDEYDTGLGYPTSGPQKMGSGGYARFFDNGVAILNPTSSPITVRNNDLASLEGYQGPYFRFRGNQDPAHNNGELFESLKLDGYSDKKRKLDLARGDGIILLREQRSVVADIIIDNLPYGTTPMMVAAQLKGKWQQTVDGRNQYRSISRERKAWYPHAVAAGGSGGAVATFRPKLAIAGQYEIFEWHGEYPGKAATNVPLTIDVNGHKTKTLVDQSRRKGRWNSLGVFELPHGTSTSVTISNEADGFVLADAIKFDFLSEDE